MVRKVSEPLCLIKQVKCFTSHKFTVEPFIQAEKGAAEQSPEYCYQKLVEAIRRLLTVNDLDPDSISSLSLTTQRASSVLLDDAYQPISPVYMWSDTRLAAPEKLSTMSWYFRLAFKVVGMSKAHRVFEKSRQSQLSEAD